MATIPPYQRGPLTSRDVQRIRLLLSTYQDGTGQYDAGASPGWRDFERTIAAAFGGSANENKAIFDVLVPHPTLARKQYGIACKMRSELGKVRRDGRVTIELTNASKQFWAELETHGIDHQNYRGYASESGLLAVNLVERWINRVGLAQGGVVDLSQSFYLVLSYTKISLRSPRSTYQLHQFPSSLPDPSTLIWTYPPGRAGTLVGTDVAGGTVFEWYGNAGGQFKYYPHERDAIWNSDEFQLEGLPNMERGIINKAATYFPELWAECYP